MQYWKRQLKKEGLIEMQTVLRQSKNASVSELNTSVTPYIVVLFIKPVQSYWSISLPFNKRSPMHMCSS